jgi:hypothetical protein
MCGFLRNNYLYCFIVLTYLSNLGVFGIEHDSLSSLQHVRLFRHGYDFFFVTFFSFATTRFSFAPCSTFCRFAAGVTVVRSSGT